jgi:hypothetical protein
MSASRKGKGMSPRQKPAKLKKKRNAGIYNNQGGNLNTEIANGFEKVTPKETVTEIPKVEKEENMPVEVESEKQNTIVVAAERPITSGGLQIAETFSSAGIRPISASNIQVVETINIMGIRPIGANTIDVVGTMNLSGIRPISSSHLVISESYSVMGNRPVASNEIDDSENMMGFLD